MEDTVFLENFVPILVPYLDDVRTYFIENLPESLPALTTYLPSGFSCVAGLMYQMMEKMRWTEPR
jgi:hypothetical protein